MKSKKLIIITLVLIISFYCSGQIPQKSIMLGGEFNIPIIPSQNRWEMMIKPNIGYLIVDNFALGFEINSYYVNGESTKYYDLGFGPFARYYLNFEKIKPFGNIKYIYSTTFSNHETQHISSHYYTIGIGAAYFLNPNISIETIVSYNHQSNHSYQSVINIHFGFQIFLHPTVK